MDIQLLGGKDEIGGNKILLEHKGTRIFLDFGTSFKTYGTYFSGFSGIRKFSALTDAFEIGLLPRLDGVYRQDFEQNEGIESKPTSIDAVFLTHAHSDHVGSLPFLRPEIPIYSTLETRLILQALDETGATSIDNYTTFFPAFTFYQTREGKQSRADRRKKELIRERPFKIMAPKERVKIGALEIEMHPVDHSLPGACGYIVYSDEGNLVCTGDLRLHGSDKALTERFIEAAAQAKPKWLLCEGTRVMDTKGNSEADVYGQAGELVRSCDGLVITEYPARDLDRVKTFYEIAKNNGRHFVINTKLAYLLDLFEKNGVKHITPKDSNVRVLLPRQSWGLIGRQGLQDYQVEQDYETWERPYLSHPNAVTPAQITKDQKQYVLSSSLWAIANLLDIRPIQGSAWIKSTCEPFSDDMELDEQMKANWLRHFGVRLSSIHASGHAGRNDLQRIMTTIAPQILVPMHTEHPDELRNLLAGTTP